MSDRTEAEPSGRPAFVGREREMAQLVTVLERAIAGRGSLAMIAGEPGIGKSRLGDEFAELARAKGCEVLWGRCWEAGGAPAYWPWVQALRQYVRSSPADELADDVGDGASHLAQILPDIMSALPDVRTLPEPSDPDASRFALFDATATFLVAMADRAPVLLILDDLHIADAASLLMLRFVARELHRGRVMLLGAYRDPNPEQRAELPPDLDRLANEAMTSFIPLAGLEDPDVTRYIDRIAGVSPPASLVSLVCEETEGNPLFIGELVRLLVAEGRLADWGPGSRLALPASVHEAIGRRLAHLSGACSRILTSAAVLGHEFDPDLVAQLEDVQPQEIASLIDEAVGSRVLTEAPDPGRFRFAHALIRDALYDAIPPGDRVDLHRRIGESLEALPENERNSHLAELAHHFFLAIGQGDTDKAIDYARRAADDSAGRLAFEEAARLYRTALDAIEAREPIDERVRCEVLVRMGAAQERSGDLVAARETLAAGARLAKRLGMVDELVTAATAYGGWYTWMRSGGDDRLVLFLEGALKAVGDEPSARRVRVLARLACALRDSHDTRRSDELSDQAVQIARRLEEPKTLAHALDGRFGATWWPDNPEDRYGLSEELLTIAQASEDIEIEGLGHHCRLVALLEVGDIAGVDAELAKLRSIADEFPIGFFRWMTTVTACNLAGMRGQLDDVERLIEAGRDMGGAALLTDAETHVATHTYRVARERGRPGDAIEVVRRTAEASWWYPFLRCMLVDLHLQMGDETSARALYLELAQDGFDALPRDNEWLLALSILAPIAAHFGEARDMEILHTALLPYRERHAVGHSEGSTGSVARALGVLAAGLGEFAEAEKDFEEALQINARMGATLWTAHTLVEYAAMLRRRDASGDRMRAEELLRACGTICVKHGFTAILERVEQLQGPSPREVADLPTKPPRQHTLRREGEYWSIAYGGDAFRLRDTKGLHFLAHLLASPGRETHALDLIRVMEGATVQRASVEGELNVAGGDAGAMLDAQAKAEYASRLQELEHELVEAEEWNDSERAARLKGEHDFIVAELAAAVGLGGRDRLAASDSERARVSVTRAIRSAIDRISKADEELGRHLSVTVRTGTYCSYQPDPASTATWSFS